MDYWSTSHLSVVYGEGRWRYASSAGPRLAWQYHCLWKDSWETWAASHEGAWSTWGGVSWQSVSWQRPILLVQSQVCRQHSLRGGCCHQPKKSGSGKIQPEPRDLKSLKPFLGFCRYYCRFIANYSSIVCPLTELMKGYPPAHKGRKAQAKDLAKVYYKVSEPFRERWDQACQKAL